MPAYAVGLHAVTTQADQSRFDDLKKRLLEEIQPKTMLENILADEIVHASWELDRIQRALGQEANIQAADRLDAASKRATRNVQRALRELRMFHSAHANIKFKRLA